jgi:hypothetical protein
MSIRIGKPALAAIVVACAGIAAYWYWSPWLALRAMQTAAVAHDADAFNAHVDYPRVRTSLKAQFSRRLAGQMEKSADPNNPMASLGAMLGRSMAEKMVDAMVRPETIMRIMQSGQFGPRTPDAAPAAPPEAAGAAPGKPKWTIVREGSNRLVAMPEGAATLDKKVYIVFERSGFAHWNLTDVRLQSP